MLPRLQSDAHLTRSCRLRKPIVRLVGTVAGKECAVTVEKPFATASGEVVFTDDLVALNVHPLPYDLV
jgi:hypothetical protein